MPRDTRLFDEVRKEIARGKLKVKWDQLADDVFQAVHPDLICCRLFVKEG